MEHISDEGERWNERLEDALSYIGEMRENLKSKMDESEKKQSILIKQVEQLRVELENHLAEKESQKGLFSPYQSKDDSDKQKKLMSELEHLKDKLDEVTSQNKSLKKEQDRLRNLYECTLRLEQYEKIYSEDNLQNSSLIKLGSTEKLGKKILHTQEIERKRIAGDLHDSTVQNLASLIHKIELCIKLMDIDPIRARLELMTMTETVKTTINGMREIIYDLRPMTINDIGLVATVNQYFEKIKQNQKLQLLFDVKGKEQEKNVPNVITLTLYRIIQEACNNMIKYAEASTLWVQICYEKNQIRLTIKDDGIGFKIEDAVYTEGEYHGFGLSIMKERVCLLSGTIEIKSEINKGTQIYITVPYDDNRGDEN
ncbi:MAG: histidine kinase [Lachnospiraceae bacterium]|nr:histidine kinase [Lachnospiraceae bacterium]